MAARSPSPSSPIPQKRLRAADQSRGVVERHTALLAKRVERLSKRSVLAAAADIYPRHPFGAVYHDRAHGLPHPVLREARGAADLSDNALPVLRLDRAAVADSTAAMLAYDAGLDPDKPAGSAGNTHMVDLGLGGVDEHLGGFIDGFGAVDVDLSGAQIAQRVEEHVAQFVNVVIHDCFSRLLIWRE